MSFSKVLVANRGEIALRIIRSLNELGVRSAAIYSEADVDCLHKELADEAHLVGPPPATKSYLNAARIVEVAKEIGADAIHPGYGFLAENGEFAELCETSGLAFIGPTPENMRLAGDKLKARQTVAAAGVPVVPGSDQGFSSLEETIETCAAIGYPLMLKASAGGGGRGMRILKSEQDLKEDFAMAAAEARAAFGDPTLYVEKYILRPRHIEVQILSDGKGDAVHLFERNCSVQRRHQKLIEEAPSPNLLPEVRQAIHASAVKIAKAIGYRNAGTVEFLLDADNQFYFMELNARIQVEHPVTEMISGRDLVKAQLSIAMGNGIGFQQTDIRQQGHAIECRINAEDPSMAFVPSPGTIDTYRSPGGFGVRWDTHLYSGYEIPIYYDSLLGKLIAWGGTRGEAIRIMQRALLELTIEPVKTTKPFLLQVIQHDDFVRGQYDLDLVQQILDLLENQEDGF
jgi:acetyl-CoA carboxylase biotin carboxylase subunit